MTYEEYQSKITELGLSSYTVSQLSGVSKAVLSQWKNGKTQPSRATQNKLQSFFNSYEPAMPYAYTGQNIVIDENYINQLAGEVLHITSYGLQLDDGKRIELTKQQYNDLQKNIKIFIYAWLKANDIL